MKNYKTLSLIIYVRLGSVGKFSPVIGPGGILANKRRTYSFPGAIEAAGHEFVHLFALNWLFKLQFLAYYFEPQLFPENSVSWSFKFQFLLTNLNNNFPKLKSNSQPTAQTASNVTQFIEHHSYKIRKLSLVSCQKSIE